MEKMQRTNLVWDAYIDYLIDAINESKFMKRAEDKPMTTPKTAKETHVTSRATHLRECADIARRLAKGLGLNDGYIRAAMLMHDAGHPFSAHEGEEIFNYLGDVHNTQYFHHNAKGIEIILSEDLCGNAISRIPGIENKPELRKQLEGEFPYFLDVIISHDGEATKSDMMKPGTPYETMDDAIKAKLHSANCLNQYKAIAQTPEGILAKFADVLAYLPTDIQDGFRLGIVKDFCDDYLEVFGQMFSEDYLETREERVEFGRKFVEDIKGKYLRDKADTMGKIKQDADMKNALTTVTSNVNKEKLDIHIPEHKGKINAIVEAAKQDYKEKKLAEFFGSPEGATIPEDRRGLLEETINIKIKRGISLDDSEKTFARALNMINSDTCKVEEFAVKVLRVRSAAVYAVTSRMKEYFINDLLRNSQNQSTPQFSNAAWNLFFALKKINYKEIVQYTNWDYQTQELPEAAMLLTEKCADSLVRAGAIRNKFYDPAVRMHIQDQEALEYMETQYRPEDEYITYRKANGIGDLKAVARTSKANFTGPKEQHSLMKLFADAYACVQNKDEVFAMSFVNTFHAVKTRIARKIETALSEKHEVSETHLYRKQVQEQVDAIRQEIMGDYGTTELTQEQRQKFIAQKVQDELAHMEQKMAIQMAIDYLAGMADKTFIELAIETGCLSAEAIARASRPRKISEKVQALIEALNAETAGQPSVPKPAGGPYDSDGGR